MKRLVWIALLLCCQPLLAKTGVVFIHGKGGHELQDPLPARNYWGTGETDLVHVVNGNPNTTLICRYDGTTWVWRAADAVVGQIVPWMASHDIDDIVVVTHSFGGVVIRWILSNPNQNPNYAKVIARIRWVDSIAPPNAGSEAANLAETASRAWVTRKLVKTLGEGNGATQNCTTFYMAYLNAHVLRGAAGRPPLPARLYTVAGDRPFNTEDKEDAALETIAYFAGFPGANDGMVSVRSAQSAGTPWLTTHANHHHNRRNEYGRLRYTPNVGLELAKELEPLR